MSLSRLIRPCRRRRHILLSGPVQALEQRMLLSGTHSGGLNVYLGDGSVKEVSEDVTESVSKDEKITISGGRTESSDGGATFWPRVGDEVIVAY